jgi:LysM repeat protein
MSALQNKYNRLIQELQISNVDDLKIREENNVLYIDGLVDSESAKDRLWDIYNQIDPDYRSGDVVMNLGLKEGAEEIYEVQKGDNLSKIGKKYGVTWKQIFENNKDIISNPDLIQPGWKLKIPSK